MPGLRVEAVVCNSAEVEAAILDNRVDLGLIEAGPSSAELAAIPFMEDALCAIAAPGHPLAGKEGVTLRELASYPFLMREKRERRPGGPGRRPRPAGDCRPAGLGKRQHPGDCPRRFGGAGGCGPAFPASPAGYRGRDGGGNRPAASDPPPAHILHHKNKFISRSIGNFIALCRDYGEENPLPPAETGGNG